MTTEEGETRSAVVMTPLTLIVATTPSLGIGLRGSLPWPSLKGDMAFFARVTKRVISARGASHAVNSGNGGSTTGNTQGQVRNAVIMGRKTWDSIPPRFRPLKDRVNVVVTRSPDSMGQVVQDYGDDVIAVGSIEAGLKELDRTHATGLSKEERSKDDHGLSTKFPGRVFVIGGAEIYKLALDMDACERVLWTRIRRDFECDTFFPKGVLHQEDQSSRSLDEGDNRFGTWTNKSASDLDAWAGEAGAATLKKEADTEFEVLMLEKKRR